MAHLFKDLSTDTAYIDWKPMIGLPELDRASYEQSYRKKLSESSTVYIGNLRFDTLEEHIYDLFTSVGVIKDIIMGLDRIKKTACGFCFVEFSTHAEAEDAVAYLNGRKLNGKKIRVDWDVGNVRKENRYWGRGAAGGQVRDEYRKDFDPTRGGLGARAMEQLGAEPVEQELVTYSNWAYTSFNEHKRFKRDPEEDQNEDLYQPYVSDLQNTRS
eukprot:TRINITY_DN17115_c0_g1_i1.p1 TRINITY_DN17115_c0_g1~~TRINITY_DN17115_c0_g1_i1.p1  ORF type:complete len:228 (+),score=27.42 TRINITY_DN17115_c0_g1_i1:45-686(+)